MTSALDEIAKTGHKAHLAGDFIVTSHACSRYKITETNIQNFVTEWALVDWTTEISSEEADHAFNEFYNSIMTCFYTHFHQVDYGRTETKDKPWFDETLQSMVKDINKAYCKYKSLACDYKKDINKRCCNKFNMAITRAKRRYAALMPADSDSTCKQWKVFNKITLPYARQQIIESVVSENRDVIDPKEIADTFNLHFTQIGSILANSIHSERYVLGSINHLFELHPVDPEEISKIIMQLRNAAPGYDLV